MQTFEYPQVKRTLHLPGKSSSSPNKPPSSGFLAFLPLDDFFFLTVDSASLLSKPGRSESESKSISFDFEELGFLELIS